MALQASRQDTLKTFAVVEGALGGQGLAVPYDATLNPPLWELGHIGWFQAYWIGRNPQLPRGLAADPHAARSAGLRDDADALYNSSRVPHASRWHLPLPDAARTRDELQAVLDQTLALLADTASDHQALYFYRLALLHEDMHHEAALYMAQALGLAINDARWQTTALAPPAEPIALPAARVLLGQGSAGFAFDNELTAHAVSTAAFEIDAQVLRWADYLPFVQAGGYDRHSWWSPAGWAWRAGHTDPLPRYLRQHGTGWQHWRHGQWQALDTSLAACHLSQHEALAWCAWAGRRLPTETEWEHAALAVPERFDWGAVWEWTASPFEPYPGFAAHPYQDYSAPWFGTRSVLRGASFATQPRMRNPRYRNFFTADRNDIFAGFRSCAR